MMATLTNSDRAQLNVALVAWNADPTIGTGRICDVVEAIIDRHIDEATA